MIKMHAELKKKKEKKEREKERKKEKENKLMAQRKGNSHVKGRSSDLRERPGRSRY